MSAPHVAGHRYEFLDISLIRSKLDRFPFSQLNYRSCMRNSRRQSKDNWSIVLFADFERNLHEVLTLLTVGRIETRCVCCLGMHSSVLLIL